LTKHAWFKVQARLSVYYYYYFVSLCGSPRSDEALLDANTTTKMV